MSFCSDLTDKMRTLINPEIKVSGDMDYPEVYIPLNNKEVIEKVKEFMFERGYVHQDCGQSNDLQYMICTFKKGLNYKPNTLKINERQLKKLVKESVVKFLKEEIVARHASDRKPWEFTPGDTKFNYMLLSRLQTDCDYFLGYGNRYEKDLWAGNVNDHIEMMKKIWNGFEEKPEWLSMEQIEDYERKMKNNNTNNDIDGMKINETQLRKIIKESLSEYIGEDQLMSGFDISPYNNHENNWNDKLSHSARSLFLIAQNDREICDIKNAIVKSLSKKNTESLSIEKLANSSVMEKICSLAVKLEITGGGERPTTSDRKQFKEFYANYILTTDLPQYIEDQQEKSIDNIVNENIKRVLKENKYSNPVTKWIYWCFNYHRPEEFIEALVGSKEHHLYQHFLDKFNHLCKRYGSDAAMNRFFVELDETWRQRLLDYVEKSYF